MDPAVKKETGYIAVWVILLSMVMEGVFLLLHHFGLVTWDLSVLFGNLGGGAAAVGSFFLLALTVSKAVASGKPEQASQRVKASAGLRLIGTGAVCALLIGVARTNPFATLIPLLFPRIGLMFRPAIDRRRGVSPPDTEGSDLIE